MKCGTFWSNWERMRTAGNKWEGMRGNVERLGMDRKGWIELGMAINVRELMESASTSLEWLVTEGEL